MKKNVLIFIILFITQVFIFSQTTPFELGSVQSKNGAVNVDYMQRSDGKGDYIRLSIVKDSKYANILVPQDIADFRKYIDKFAEWHKIAVENKWDLNKSIGSLTNFRVEFLTVNSQYSIIFIDLKSGAAFTSFTLEQIKALKDIITDEKIDYALNKEKRRKEKEDSLFK